MIILKNALGVNPFLKSFSFFLKIEKQAADSPFQAHILSVKLMVALEEISERFIPHF
jgi:hypothetical protein